MKIVYNYNLSPAETPKDFGMLLGWTTILNSIIAIPLFLYAG